MANHYIRTDETGIIIYGFSDEFEQPQDGDIMILADGPRHFNQVWPESLVNDDERGQYRFKWVDGERVERTQEDLDAEWAARPPDPKTPDQLRVEELEAQLSVMNTNNIEFMEMILQTLGVE